MELGQTREVIALLEGKVHRDGALWVKGSREVDADHNRYLFKGIDAHGFQRSFQLPEHVKVSGASLAYGMLHIELFRDLPEEMRPRRIEIAVEEDTRPVLTDASQAA